MNNEDYIPKYIKIKNHIQEYIENGKFEVGSKLPTEFELAQQFEVSRHTVRKALNLIEQKGLLYKRQGVGTFVKKQESEPTNNVGFISISLRDYIFADILQGIDDVFHEWGYQILLGNSGDDQEKEKEILEEFLRKEVDGLIIEPAQSAYNYPNLEFVEKFANKNIPVVFLDSKFENDRFNYVTIDDVEGGFLATNHLLEKGHENIAIIYKTMHKPGLARKEGYKKALHRHELPVYNAYVKGYYNSEFEAPAKFEEEIKGLSKDLISLETPPTAVFCFNDQIAILVKEILENWGLRVPEDISLIGFDDSRLVKLSNISLTSVAHPKQKAGKKAAQIILDNINNKEAGESQNIVFRPELIKRGSVKAILKKKSNFK